VPIFVTTVTVTTVTKLLDIVALGLDKNTAEVYEVKRHAKNFKPDLLIAKKSI